MRTLGLIFAWLWAFFFILAALVFIAQRLRKRAGATPGDDLEDEEAERWRRAFEGTEYEWERPEVKR